MSLDVDDPESVRRAADLLAADYGRLDILVNNAGILPEATAADATQPLDAELFLRTYRTNVLGVVAVTQAFLPLLERSAAGRIVNVSSRMGSLADQTDVESPYYGLVMPAYQTSKAALNGVTIALAKKLAGSPIKVNAVCPGWVKTDLGGPENRAAAPLTADDAAVVIARAALLDEAGPTGGFFDAAGTVPW
ncbi:MAG: SDR family NAD(P)-dependent oxidoreductase [Microlunatus sp.]|nr:SDR family NAD(P)-dependent oxidoreductase [Microlunatus sp.]